MAIYNINYINESLDNDYIIDKKLSLLESNINNIRLEIDSSINKLSYIALTEGDIKNFLIKIKNKCIQKVMQFFNKIKQLWLTLSNKLRSKFNSIKSKKNNNIKAADQENDSNNSNVQDQPEIVRFDFISFNDAALVIFIKNQSTASGSELKQDNDEFRSHCYDLLHEWKNGKSNAYIDIEKKEFDNNSDYDRKIMLKLGESNINFFNRAIKRINEAQKYTIDKLNENFDEVMEDPDVSDYEDISERWLNRINKKIDRVMILTQEISKALQEITQTNQDNLSMSF